LANTDDMAPTNPTWSRHCITMIISLSYKYKQA
jgi:hypothetical protein